ncbi:1910_t:CDS:2, partial [Paraglomus occultum]
MEAAKEDISLSAFEERKETGSDEEEEKEVKKRVSIKEACRGAH